MTPSRCCSFTRRFLFYFIFFFPHVFPFPSSFSFFLGYWIFYINFFYLSIISFTWSIWSIHLHMEKKAGRRENCLHMTIMWI